MTTKKLVTQRFRVSAARVFQRNIALGENSYYLFAGRHIPYEPDDSVIATPNDSVQSHIIDVYDNMIFGKKIMPTDVAIMISKKDWASGLKWDMYDHEDDELYEKNFYCIVNNGATHNVYKCLDNNGGANSTVEPSGTDINPIYSPVDGYLWKYMFTIPDITYNKFKTTNYVPIVANTSVSTNAKTGTIEAIKVLDGGLGYDNYFTGAFGPSDIRIDGNELIYGLSAEASLTPDFYQGCVIKITSGNSSGEYREIVNYAIENGYKKIYLDTAFSTTPSPNDTYEIYPLVYVYGNGSETANCVARAIISSQGNTVSRVEILNAGRNYRAAVGVLQISNVVNVIAQANLSPIMSPPGGHGFDPYFELGGNRTGISVQFANTEGGLVPAVNDYRTVGIVRNPLFTGVDVSIETSNTQGTFIANENVYQYRDVVLAGEVSVTAGSPVITGTDTFFDTSVKVGDVIHVDSGVQHHFAPVIAVTNSTSLTCSSNVFFTDSTCQISVINRTLFGKVYAYNTGTLSLYNVNSLSSPTSNSKIYGELNHASTKMTGNTLTNGVSKGFNTFVQLEKLVGELTLGEFSEDEIVYQESALELYKPEAKYFSITETDGEDIMYVSNLKHIFATNTAVFGSDSGAVFNLSNKYSGDLIKDSGEVIYLENIDPITRLSNRTETLKIILEF